MKPVGSGYFAVLFGLAFLAALASSFFVQIDQLPPQWILRAWFAFIALVLTIWGAIRVWTGDKTRLAIGQDTINFVIGILAATFVLMALLHDVSEKKIARSPAATTPTLGSK